MTMSVDAASDAATREDAYQQFVEANLPRNYLAHFIHGMLGLTGFRVVNAPTLIPVYLHTVAISAMATAPGVVGLLGGPNGVVGFGAFAQQVGFVLSPIIGASQIEHRKKVLPVAVMMGTLMRAQLLIMAVAGWLFARQPTPLLFAILFSLFLFGLFSGPQRVAFQILLAKVIPIRRRGRLQGWRNLTGGLIAAALSWAAGKYLIGRNVFGNGYSTTLLCSFVLTSLGLTCLRLMMREPEPPKVRAKSAIHQRLREFPSLLRDSPQFRWFIIAHLLTTAGRLSAPFYILHARLILTLTGAHLGLISLVYLGADTISNVLWGYCGDRFGFRSTYAAGVVAWLLATAFALLAHSEATLYLSFFLLGASQSSFQMSSQTLVLELGDRDDMAMRVALTATAEGLMASLGPLIGGVLAASLGYDALLITSLVIESAALVTILLFVAEPRRRQGSSTT